MQTLQVIVTSYQRLKYLKRTVDSLRQDPIELYIVDGGSDEETCDYIKKVADGYTLLKDNPGADVLKNEGIQRFATRQEFMLSSDDLEYPKGYAAWALEQYRWLNHKSLEWTFVACSMDYIDKHPPRPFVSISGVDVLEVATCQVSGAIIDLDVCRRLGYFPVYGRSGQGDWAFSKKVREAGYRMGYLRRPCLKHLGANKWTDYPEYSLAFEEDERRYQAAAKANDVSKTKNL